MSFTTDVKEELAHVAPTCSRCSMAVLSGIVRTEGTLFIVGTNQYRVEISTDFSHTARLALSLLHKEFGLETKVIARRSVLHNTPNYLIEVVNQPKLTEALTKLGILEQGGLCFKIPKHLLKKPCCAVSFIRGIFLGSGFISNPTGDFHFEMTVEQQIFAEGLVELLEEQGVSSRILKRRNTTMIYIKKASTILKFLAMTGAYNSALKMENERVIKSVRSDVNRQTNAEVANQAKTVSASMTQIAAIKKVVDTYGVEKLPQALGEVILLRLRHKEASLKELGELANPPLSKSAINHRMRRIEQMAAEIDEESQQQKD